jgi:Ni/Co efflux regulator RcnB
MRKLLISLLLAGAAATPAIAGPHNWSDNQQANDNRQQVREERQQAREERQQAREESRADRSSNFQRPQFNPQQVQVRQQEFTGGGQRFDARPDRGSRFGGNPGAYVAPDARAGIARERLDQMRAQQVEQRNQRIEDRQLRQSDRPVANVLRDRHPLVVSDVPRPGTQPPLRADNYRRGGEVHWNTNWRNDNHYDWRRYRDHHRSRFHLGFYIDPFGWGYQPFSIGYRMWPSYYGNRYWIDPGLYGLPYPPPGAAWVRYYNDVMLIDLYSGTILDVIPGFFW